MAKGKNYTKKQFLTMQSSVRTIAFKFYEEQVTTGSFNDIIEDILKIDPSEYEVIGIIHNRDTNHDDVWDPSIEKPHMHVIIRITCRPFKKMTPVKVRTMLNLLPHLQYRLTKKDKETGEILEEGPDDTLWKEHGAETVLDFAHYAVYLTHDTEKAIADGKAHYEIEEYVTNLPLEIIKQIRDGYQLYSIDASQSRPSYETMKKLDEVAYKLGYDLGDYDEWYGSLSYGIRKNAGFKTIKESFYRGTQARLKEHEEIGRICIYIEGAPGTGKTKTSLVVCERMGLEVLDASGQGTGRYDRLTPHTEAIILSDDVTANLLNLADQYVCGVYKRGSNNPIWAGHYLIVTQNVPFDEWVGKCGYKDKENIDAVKSRFFICHIEEHTEGNKLICDAPMKRKVLHKDELMKKFKAFKAAFDTCHTDYVQSLTHKYEDCDLADFFSTSTGSVRYTDTYKAPPTPAEIAAEARAKAKADALKAEAKKAEILAKKQQTAQDCQASHDANLAALDRYRADLEKTGLERLKEPFDAAYKKSVFHANKEIKRQLQNSLVSSQMSTYHIDLRSEIMYEALVKGTDIKKLHSQLNYLDSYAKNRVVEELISYGIAIVKDEPDEELPFSWIV